MDQGGTLREEGTRGRKPAWLRATKRHERAVRTVDGAERRRERQLDEFRKMNASRETEEMRALLRVHAFKGTAR